MSYDDRPGTWTYESSMRDFEGHPKKRFDFGSTTEALYVRATRWKIFVSVELPVLCVFKYASLIRSLQPPSPLARVVASPIPRRLRNRRAHASGTSGAVSSSDSSPPVWCRKISGCMSSPMDGGGVGACAMAWTTRAAIPCRRAAHASLCAP